ncbi:MAG: metal-sensitive transcriptional regulator [Syntrophomonadaceae bacterium]|nr:metal-sensitive transcriptional regulator [Syntrophomonadaceae bacterium]MDD4550384.1 metal-sensitive transcriptional regulator [Syntrophomonadaceae bacterium]
MLDIEYDISRKKILMRLKRIEGQVRGVQRMVEEQAGCKEILTQVAAIKSAMSQVGIMVFENHAQDCISRAMNEENKEDSFKEMVDLMAKLIK